MKAMITECLTYEQLREYSLHKCEKPIRAKLYLHISSCELCACAVNGFTATSFLFTDVEAIHHRIDMKVKPTFVNPLTVARLFFVSISVLLIVGFYHFANSFSVNKPKLFGSEMVQSEKRQNIVLKKDYSIVYPIPDVMNKKSNVLPFSKNKNIGKKAFVTEPLSNITPGLHSPEITTTEVHIESRENADVIYIYDLKITQYNSLYLNQKGSLFEINGHTPAFKEHSESKGFDVETERDVFFDADKILKSSLLCFNKGNYFGALEGFQLLSENNPTDINAMFYSAVSYYQIADYNRAIKKFESVLKSSNNVFHPEAKWNLALVHLKIGNKWTAKKMLEEIVSEKGFYARKASEKLRTQ